DRSQRPARPLPAAAPAGTVRWRASTCHRSDRPHPGGSATRTLRGAASCRGGEDRAGAQGASALVPQPPRLRATDAVPFLRFPVFLPQLRRLAGGPPLPAPARVPPLRLLHTAPALVSEMPGERQLRRLRAGRRAPRGGSRRTVPAGPDLGA